MKTKKECIEQLLNEKGILQIFAIDHRGVFTDSLDKSLGHPATLHEIRCEKERLMKLAAPYISGYLIDPISSIVNGHITIDLQGHSFMMGIENSNYDIQKIDGTYLNPDVSVRDMKELGCHMVKLFVYYHPQMEFRKKILDIIMSVARDCEEEGLPFLLEPIIYGDKPYTQKEHHSLLKETLHQLRDIPVTIYKLEFPGDIDTCSEEENIAFCQEISELLDCPWIVLSSGVSPQVFEKQIMCAGKGQACGFAAGRSIWKDGICGTKDDDKRIVEVMKRFQETANTYCSSFWLKGDVEK